MTLQSYLKSRIQRSLFRRGYALTHVDQAEFGVNPFSDMKALSQAGSSPIVFDVGANRGQSVEKFRGYFASPVVHAFEPGEAAFRDLERNLAGLPDVHLNPIGLGSRPERKVFVENDHSDMSSFLEPDQDAWGSVTSRRELSIDTIDAVCARNAIAHIDILKTDTQGFDLEVFRGAQEMFGAHRIHLVYTEIIFSRMYKDLPRFDEIYGFLADRGLALVSIYSMHYQNRRAGWSDALFIDPQYQNPRAQSG